MKVLVIIVTYNGMKWIEKCLHSLRQSTHPLTTIVIDNNSTDGTPDYIVKNYPEVVMVRKDYNLGFGQANNVGMRYALDNGFDYVLLLNQDAYLQPDAVAELLKVADDRNLFSPLHLSGDGKRMDWFCKESLRMADNDLLDDLLIEGKAGSAYEIGEVCAACWFMPIDMLKTIGGFNPLFFHYGEDNNYYTRLQYHQRKTIIVPAAHVWHDRGMFGNEKVYQQRKIKNRIYVVFCNPNLNTKQRVRKLIRVIIEEPLLATIREFIFALKSYGKCVSSRKKEQQPHSTWL